MVACAEEHGNVPPSCLTTSAIQRAPRRHDRDASCTDQEHEPKVMPLDSVFIDSGSKSAFRVEAIELPRSPSPPSASNTGKIPFLDGVRGFAAMLVVAQHCEYMRGLNVGAIGVDIFFVLSSFLLTMIFERKARQLWNHGATRKQWCIALADYFMKRFMRVYPLFVIVAIVIWMLPKSLQKQYYNVPSHAKYNLYKVLTFHSKFRFHMLWTLPLEIAYYFILPLITVISIALRHRWWMLAAIAYAWITYEGCTQYRKSFSPLRPHLPTFVTGSLAAFIYAQVKRWQQSGTMSTFSLKLKLLINCVRGFTLALLLSICFRGLLFSWVVANPFEDQQGDRFVSVPFSALLVIELVNPSWISRAFEWNILREWGKVSYSLYLLHVYAVYTPAVRKQKTWDRFVATYVLSYALAFISFHVFEVPIQRLTVVLSKFIHAKAGQHTITAAPRTKTNV